MGFFCGFSKAGFVEKPPPPPSLDIIMPFGEPPWLVRFYFENYFTKWRYAIEEWKMLYMYSIVYCHSNFWIGLSILFDSINQFKYVLHEPTKSHESSMLQFNQILPIVEVIHIFPLLSRTFMWDVPSMILIQLYERWKQESWHKTLIWIDKLFSFHIIYGHILILMHVLVIHTSQFLFRMGSFTTYESIFF